MMLRIEAKSVLGVNKKMISGENLNFCGFVLSGIGSLLFFFVYAGVAKTTLVGDLGSEYSHHTLSIRKYWMKNINGENNFLVKNIGDSDLCNKSEWTKRKKFAFWALDNGVVYSFFLVAFGFVLQFVSKFI